jgi:hypothetical protein
MKQGSVLKDWLLEDRGEYYAITGKVYNDDRFNDGSTIHTSMLMSIDFEHSTARTRNTEYMLR